MSRYTTCRLALALTSELVLAVAGCARQTFPASPGAMPAPADRSDAAEIQAGADAAEYLRRTVGLVEDATVQAYVQSVGAAVAAQSARPALPWRFAVLDDALPNAFALPGGAIFVTRGMLADLDSEAELAGLLGHEIAHVAARHDIQALGQISFPQLAILPSMPAPPAAGLQLDAGIAMLFRQYGRQAESQADVLGIDYAVAAGYDAREMEGVFAVLERRDLQAGRMTPVFLSTHPSAAERVALVRARIAALDPPADLRVGRDDFLRHIDGLVYGADPRNGFFHGTAFYHFAEHFAIALPPLWEGRNLGRLAVAVAPDGAAVLQVTTLALPAVEAERRLLALPGLVGHRISCAPIGGRAGRVVAFEMTTERGTRHGLAAYVAHDGRTHEIIGFVASGASEQYAFDIVNAITSFEMLDDPAIDAVTPLRLHIERIADAMTLEAFAQRYANAAPLDDLVILNHAADATTPLTAGRLVKRVAVGR